MSKVPTTCPEPPAKKRKLEMSKNNSQKLKYQTFDDFKLKNYNRIYSTKHISSDINKIQIQLTQNEKKTFNEFLEAFKDKKVIIRAAGGWVRDKILNTYSDDIDLTLDTMNGEQFGNHFLEFYAKKHKNYLKITTIEANPEQSKHLASIRFRLNGIEFDVVNLRKEVYCDDSRIPLANDFGTPKEDAERRDLTFNALFYNLNKNCVEDFTGSGVKDLIHGVARTPLDAMKTYRDDPLRILRNIRHAITKLGFVLSDDIIVSAQKPEIHNLLCTKVSRERFAQEFVKILHGYNVCHALDITVKLGIANILFIVPEEKKNIDMNNKLQKAALHVRTLNEIVLDYFKKQKNSEEKKQNVVHDLKTYLGKEKQKDLIMSTFLYVFSGIKYKVSKNKQEFLTKYFMLESMPGMGKALAKKIEKYHTSAEKFMELIRIVVNNEMNKPNNEKEKVEEKVDEDEEFNKIKSLHAGEFLCVIGDDWKNVLWLVKTICELEGYSINFVDDLKNWIEKSKLVGCWKWKPIMNGKELVKEYHEYGLKGNQSLGILIKYLEHERLRNPVLTKQDLSPIILDWLNVNGFKKQ